MDFLSRSQRPSYCQILALGDSLVKLHLRTSRGTWSLSFSLKYRAAFPALPLLLVFLYSFTWLKAWHLTPSICSCFHEAFEFSCRSKCFHIVSSQLLQLSVRISNLPKLCLITAWVPRVSKISSSSHATQRHRKVLVAHPGTYAIAMDSVLLALLCKLA
jgi:hypothetical protein